MVFLGVRDKEPDTARYEGMIACTLLIDRAAGIGWRDLTQEAMAMRRVLDGTVDSRRSDGERSAPPSSAPWRNRSVARSGGTPTTARKAAVRGAARGGCRMSATPQRPPPDSATLLPA